MIWNSWSDFFAMGGFAAFVWPAFAIATLVLVGLLVSSRRHLRRAMADLAALEASGQMRRRRRGAEHDA